MPKAKRPKNICCGSSVPYGERCPRCKDWWREYNRKWQKRKAKDSKQQGLCVACRQPAQPGQSQCAKCRAYRTDWMRKKRAEQ